jgi:hypothetical protein
MKMYDNIDSDFEFHIKSLLYPPVFFSNFIGDHFLQFFKIQLWYQSLSPSFFIHLLLGKRENSLYSNLKKKVTISSIKIVETSVNELYSARGIL